MTPTPMAATATATKPEADDFLPTSSATPSLPYSSPALSHSALLPEWGTRQAAEAAATRHHHHQHSRHNSQRAGPVATCNISSKAAAARLPLPSSLSPSFLSPFPSQSLYCRSAAVVYFSLELSLECCQRKCAYVAAAAAVPSCSSSGSGCSPCSSSSTCGMPQTPANQKLLLFSATIPAPLHSPQLLPPLAASCCCCLLLLPHNGDVFVFAFAIS